MTALRQYLIVLVFILLLGQSQTALAQRSVSDNEVNAVAKQLYCPICESTPLDVCPTRACFDWREQIRTMLAEGESDGAILAYFSEQYGVQVLRKPPRKGFSLAIWLVPPLLFLFAAIVMGRYLLGLRAKSEMEPVRVCQICEQCQATLQVSDPFCYLCGAKQVAANQ